jgi:HD-GYP domain-containing protein (c-di-GMP phosphodiesterase class II)
MKIHYPVTTIDGRLLLPAGSEMDDQSMDNLLAAAPQADLKTYSLMDYGTIQKDLFIILNTAPYDVIFSDADARAEILDVIKSVRFVAPVLDVLDYFKNNDGTTYRHMLTIFALTILIARDLVPNYRKRVSEIAHGPTHDFGKICVPLEILKKDQPLTREEHDYLKHHTLAGYGLLVYYLRDSRSIAAKVARDHHERMNGRGYPRGIMQQDLMVEIVAVCDVYDALISARPYRPISYNNRTALEVLTSMAEKGEVGWRAVQSLIAHNRRSKPVYSEIVPSLKKRGTSPPGNLYGKVADSN